MRNTCGSASYGTVAVEGDRVLTGYQYPPLTILLPLPSYAVTGDFRYGCVLAIAISGYLLLGVRTPIAGACGVLLLFHPRIFFIIKQGWTEP